MSHQRRHLEDLRGASRLVIDATTGITELVESMHRTIAGGPDTLGRPLEGPVGAVLGPIYGGIRGVTKLVGAGIDGALARLSGVVDAQAPVAEHEAVLAVVNGVLGDYLHDTDNPLAIQMRLRRGGRPLTLQREALATELGSDARRLLVLVHGSCMNDRQWLRRGHDHGAALATELGFTPVYVHYNSGLHVSTNGRAFAHELRKLTDAWPGELDELVLVGHSMGGLVARSACEFAEVGAYGWRKRVSKLVCLGTPHHGAPLERGGNWIDVLLGVNRYAAPLSRLGKIRSAGVTDLRFGNVRDEDWSSRGRFEPGDDPRTPLPLPAGVDCFAIAGTLTPEPGTTLRSDGLVPVDSALGRGETAPDLEFPPDHQWIAYGTGHLDLLDSPAVYAQLTEWLREGG
jgi:pimeloyl-ACP methyl ester carboxylesterase